MLKQIEDKATWLADENIRPYVYVRETNRIAHPGKKHKLDWFKFAPVYKNPLDISEVEFAEQIYHMEGKAFGPANMAMPRWVFYDCAIVPGFVAGFAIRNSALTPSMKKVLRWSEDYEWSPLSLFIIIPTVMKGEWVAHNLCSVNSLIPKDEGLYGLGFLSKAFGLWYANVEYCCGMTQWGSPAMKLHSHYGPMQILSSYTPVHSHARTLTYRVRVNTKSWERFFTREPDKKFNERFEKTGLLVEPERDQSLIDLQHRLEKGEGPYFLSASEIAEKKLTEPLSLFQAR